MSRKPETAVSWFSVLCFSVLCFSIVLTAPAGVCQVIQPAEKVEPGHQHHQEHHHLHLPMGEAKCAPKFTYSDGNLGPSHWAELCSTGRMQAPIDIQHAEPRHIDIPKINYEPAGLDIINDCNGYRILVKFPDNYWLTVGKKPYNLTELHFREPGA